MNHLKAIGHELEFIIISVREQVSVCERHFLMSLTHWADSEDTELCASFCVWRE